MMSSNNQPTTQRKIPQYPDGVAVEPEDVGQDLLESENNTSPIAGTPQGNFVADAFVTMCFYARLGFVQPPSCLKCAYQTAGCSEGITKIQSKGRWEGSSTCHQLVPWRRDAAIPLHPDKLEGNVVFLTCATASALVNGDAYPSIRWDSRKKRLLISF